MLTSECMVVSDGSQVGEARRWVTARAGAIGLDEGERGRAAIIATEMATNLVRHARGGEILLRRIAAPSAGLELLSIDSGPGIPDVESALQDGFSTGGTMGTGLGAVRRLADDFDLRSARGEGTVVLARVFRDVRPPTAQRSTIEVGAICTPKPGESVCGDGWSCASSEAAAVLFVVDGLGHGFIAATAAQEALQTFEAHRFDAPARILTRVHEALRATRGAAAAVARLDVATGSLAYAGVGNIAGTLVTGGRTRGLVSMAGTLGHGAHRLRVFEHVWPEDALLVMHSDGLSARWTVLPWLTPEADPALVAAALYRESRRGSDDATVVVARRGREEG